MELNTGRQNQVVLKGKIQALDGALRAGMLTADQVKADLLVLIGSDQYTIHATEEIKTKAAELLQAVNRRLAVAKN